MKQQLKAERERREEMVETLKGEILDLETGHKSELHHLRAALDSAMAKMIEVHKGEIWRDRPSRQNQS